MKHGRHVLGYLIAALSAREQNTKSQNADDDAADAPGNRPDERLGEELP